MKPPTYRTLAIVLTLGLATSAYSSTVAEWTFDGETDLAAGSTLLFDASGAATASSSTSTLQTNTTYVAASTGISGQYWSTSLSFGYLNVPVGQNVVRGLRATSTSGSNAEYRDYMGFSGLGSGGTYASGPNAGDTIGGTFYSVIQPGTYWTLSDTGRKSLMGAGSGTGANWGAGWMRLWYENGDLLFNVGKGDGENISQVTLSIADYAFDTSKWYFIGASWANNQDLVLYIREMAATGPSASTAATTGTLGGVPSITSAPSTDTLLIGARYDQGGNPSDGADAKFAYAAFENTYSTVSDMNVAFSAMVPEPGTISLALVATAFGGIVLLRKRRRNASA